VNDDQSWLARCRRSRIAIHSAHPLGARRWPLDEHEVAPHVVERVERRVQQAGVAARILRHRVLRRQREGQMSQHHRADPPPLFERRAGVCEDRSAKVG
jgi:hypothetical protein